MKIEPGGIAGVNLAGSAEPAFRAAVESMMGRGIDSVLEPALQFSVVASNRSLRAIGLLGVRFDMLSGAAKRYSVIHYADTLRNPDAAALRPGEMRFVCAEPAYTEFVLRRLPFVDPRGPMNLANLRQAIEVRASIDCVAFTDGEFAGPDTHGAFERLARERNAEAALVEEVLRGSWLPDAALANRDALALARKLAAAYENGGMAETQERARMHRLRIEVRKAGLA